MAEIFALDESGNAARVALEQMGSEVSQGLIYAQVINPTREILLSVGIDAEEIDETIKLNNDEERAFKVLAILVDARPRFEEELPEGWRWGLRNFPIDMGDAPLAAGVSGMESRSPDGADCFMAFSTPEGFYIGPDRRKALMTQSIPITPLAQKGGAILSLTEYTRGQSVKYQVSVTHDLSTVDADDVDADHTGYFSLPMTTIRELAAEQFESTRYYLKALVAARAIAEAGDEVDL